MKTPNRTRTDEKKKHGGRGGRNRPPHNRNKNFREADTPAKDRPTAVPQRPTPPSKMAAGPVAGASDFDAGIFEGLAAAPVAPGNPPPKGATPAPPAERRAVPDARGSGRTRGRRDRRSRTDRLAEEAQVLTTLQESSTAESLAAATRVPASPEDESAQLDFDELEEGPLAEGPSIPRVSPPQKLTSPSRPPMPQRVTAGMTAADKREMLINVAEGDECRIAILQAGRLDELQIERASATSNVGNIYKGRVSNVEPSIQAAFIDFGLPSHGFLHISDLHNQYFPRSKGEQESVGRKTPRRERPPIQQCLKRGQEILVQVIKEGIGTKGPTLTSYISIPGRFLVMMPGLDQLGVSRKIEDEDKRRRMREMLAQLSLPKGIGFIVRTAGMDKPKRDLQRDLNYLARLWKGIEVRIKKDPAPAVIYRESDLVIRSIRDLHDSSIERIVVDSQIVAKRIREFLAIASPRARDVVEVYEGAEPLFHRHGLEAEIDRLHSKAVPLPCGGSIVIEQTEAMVAIDVNSGRFRIPENAEETAYRVNVEAVDEIARQLRLRDLGGLIVVDLIDMIQERHRRAIEKRMADALRKHKERAKILRISKFGLLEMTRQRQRPSLSRSMFRECPRCGGGGRVKAPESVALDVMRQIRLASHREGVAVIEVSVSPPVAADLLNRKRHQITDLERRQNQTIRISGEESNAVDQVSILCLDRRGRDLQTHEAAGEDQRRYTPRDRRTRHFGRPAMGPRGAR